MGNYCISTIKMKFPIPSASACLDGDMNIWTRTFQVETKSNILALQHWKTDNASSFLPPAASFIARATEALPLQPLQSALQTSENLGAVRGVSCREVLGGGRHGRQKSWWL